MMIVSLFSGQSCCWFKRWSQPNCPSCCCLTRPHSYCGGASSSWSRCQCYEYSLCDSSACSVDNERHNGYPNCYLSRDFEGTNFFIYIIHNNRKLPIIIWLLCIGGGSQTDICLNAYNMKHEGLPYRNSGAWRSSCREVNGRKWYSMHLLLHVATNPAPLLHLKFRKPRGMLF